LTVTKNGYGKRTPVSDYRLQGRGGSGIINIKTTERNGIVVGAMVVADDEQVLLITASGKIIRMNIDGISRIGRVTQGVRLIKTGDDDSVVSAIRTAEPEEDAEMPAETTPTDTDGDTTGDTTGDTEPQTTPEIEEEEES
jgi:DNA gyrase subunit A